MSGAGFNFSIKRDFVNDSTKNRDALVVPSLPGLISGSVEEGSIVFNPSNSILYYGDGFSLLPLSSGAPEDLQTTYLSSLPPNITLTGALGGLGILDNAAPIVGNLFEITDNAGATTYFSVDSTGAAVDGNLGVTGIISNPIDLILTEQAAVPMGSVAGRGQVWVRDDSPNVLMFTDDAGTDFVLNGASSVEPGIIDGDGDTSVTVEQPFGVDTDTTIFTNSGVETARMTPTGDVGIATIPAAGIRTDIALTTAAAGTNVGTRVLAEQTTSDPAGQIRGIRGEATHSGVGTQLVTYGLTGHANIESGTASFAIGSSNRAFVNNAANAGSAYGAFNQLQHDSTGTTGFGFGAFNRLRNTGVGTITSASGLFNSISNESTGTITTGIGVTATIDNTGGGTITDAYGVSIAGWSNTGTITESRALFIDSDTNVGTTSWGILSETTADSSLLGPLFVGTATPVGTEQMIVYSDTDIPLLIQNDFDDDARRDVLELRRTRSSGTAPGAGFGCNVTFNLEGFTSGSGPAASFISTIWEVAQTNDTTDRDSTMGFGTMQDNVLTESMRINSSGQLLIGATSPTSTELLHVAGDAEITGKLTVGGLIDPTGLVLTEQTVAPSGVVAGEGQVWVRDDTANVLMFTDDAGVDWQITGAGASFEIIDADGDTSVSVENNPGADSDTITMTVGDNSGNYNVTPFIFSASVGGISVVTPTAIGGGNDGVALDLTTGGGEGVGTGGGITMTSGGGGATNGDGGAINISCGSGTALGGGGNMTLTAGGGTTPGVLALVGGDATVASGAVGGDINVDAGAGDSASAGGSVVLTSGTAGATGNGGGLTLDTASGGATSGNGGDLSITTGSAGSGADSGGDIAITAGSNSNTGAGRGGHVDINSGGGDGDGTSSGTITLNAPDGSSVGGSITGFAGAGGDVAGIISFSAGNGTGLSNDGGDVTITAGNSSNADGGSIILNPGTGSGTDGDVTVNGKLTVTGLVDPTGFVGSQQPISPFDPSTTLTGTVSVTAGMAAVVGVGTLFTTELSLLDYINIAGEFHQILSITDNLNLTLSTNHVAGAAGVSYSLLGTDGTIWVRDDVPTVLVFTDSNGDDHDISGAGGAQTLAQTLVLGNITGGTDIVVSNGDRIITPLGGNNPLDLVVLGDPAGPGGDVGIAAGQGTTPGDVNVFAGNAAAASAAMGGDITLTSGTGDGVGDGGDFDIIGGQGGVGGGLGGTVTVRGGGSTTTGGSVDLLGGASATNGGSINLTSGSGLTSGGLISITGGSSGTTGGSISIDSGGGTTAGNINIAPGSGNNTAGGMNITGGAVTGIGSTGGGVSVAGGQGHTTGGSVSVIGGSGTNGGGGSINLVGAAASGVGGTGGGITATGGAGTSGNDGGAINLTAGAGTGGATSDGGGATLRGGASTNGDGGDARLNGGLGSGGVVGGFGTIIAGGSTVGGNGGDISIDAGISAAALIGGSVTLNGGAGGSGGGVGGNTSMIGGDGQAGGAGGIATVRGGTAITGNGNGGLAVLRGGSAFGTGTGVGGAIDIIASNGGNFGFVGSGGAGGVITMTAGSGGGSDGQAGGAIAITSGSGGTNGVGGGLTLLAGNAGSGPGAGGDVTITAGGGGSGGDVNMSAGNNSTLGGTGGGVNIIGGVGTGQGGDVTLISGVTGTSGASQVVVSSLSTANGNIVFSTIGTGGTGGKQLDVVRLNMASDADPGTRERHGLQWHRGDNINSFYMWVDNSGDYRTLANTIPTNENSGTVIGTQTSNAKYKTVGEQIIEHENARSHIIDVAENSLFEFSFKDGKYNKEHFPSGIIINEAPRYGMDRDEDHPEGKVLNEIVLFADLCSSVKVLTEENKMLKERLELLESKLELLLPSESRSIKKISKKTISKASRPPTEVDEETREIINKIKEAPPSSYYNLKTGRYLKTKRQKQYTYCEDPKMAYPKEMKKLALKIKAAW